MHGSAKYGEDDNWRRVPNAKIRYKDALLRHVFAHLRGELEDPETGESHLAHAACCLLFMLALK